MICILLLDLGFIYIFGADSKRTVTCTFENGYSCGYTSTQVGLMTWTRAAAAKEEAVGIEVDGDNSTSGQSTKIIVRNEKKTNAINYTNKYIYNNTK